MNSAVAAFLATALLVFSHGGFCATYHVAPGGNDRKGDGSGQNPWKTLQHAADRVNPGDTVLVKNGDYAPFHIVRDGTRENRITFKADGDKVVIHGTENHDSRLSSVSIMASHITFEGFVIQVGAATPLWPRSRGIRVSGEPGGHVHDVHVRANQVANASWVGITTSYAENVLIEKNRIWGSKEQHGIYVANSADNPVIRDNVAFDNRHAGIQINADPELPGDGIISGAVISGNILYRNGKGGSAALNLASVRDSRIYNNLLYDNFAQGIAGWDDEAGPKYGSKNNLFANNTVIMPRGARHTLSFRHGSTGNVLKNNILLHLGGRDSISVDTSSLPGLDSNHNIVTRLELAPDELMPLDRWREVTGQDRNSLAGEPDRIFDKLSGDSFTLHGDGLAVDRGINLPAVTHDITGVPRPQGRSHDIGAYEYSTTGAAPAPGAAVSTDR